MYMSKSYPMTDTTFGGSLNRFKNRVDNAIDKAADMVAFVYDELSDASYSKRGGLRFLRIGRLNISVSVTNQEKYEQRIYMDPKLIKKRLGV